MTLIHYDVITLSQSKNKECVSFCRKWPDFEGKYIRIAITIPYCSTCICDRQSCIWWSQSPFYRLRHQVACWTQIPTIKCYRVAFWTQIPTIKCPVDGGKYQNNVWLLLKVPAGWIKVEQFAHLKTGCLSCFSCCQREMVIWRSNITTQTLISSYNGSNR